MKLEIKEIRKFKEDEINKEIQKLDEPNLNYQQKRLKVLDSKNTSKSYPDFIIFPGNKIQILDIAKIRQFRENEIQEKIKNIKDNKLTYTHKRLKILSEMNTSIEEDEEYNSNKENISLLNSTLNSTMPSEINEISIEFKKYCIDYELYDVKQNIYIDNPTLNKLDEDKFFYLYKNELITYHFIKNIKFGKEYSINNNVITDDNFNQLYGLFYCGIQIKLDNEENRICNPHNMMCKDCMNKNKKRYNLKNHYCININGRAAKKYDELFHCFGHFEIGKRIEICVNDFQCEACKFLDKYKNYYFP